MCSMTGQFICSQHHARPAPAIPILSVLLGAQAAMDSPVDLFVQSQPAPNLCCDFRSDDNISVIGWRERGVLPFSLQVLGDVRLASVLQRPDPSAGPRKPAPAVLGVTDQIPKRSGSGDHSSSHGLGSFAAIENSLLQSGETGHLGPNCPWDTALSRRRPCQIHPSTRSEQAVSPLTDSQPCHHQARALSPRPTSRPGSLRHPARSLLERLCTSPSKQQPTDRAGSL